MWPDRRQSACPPRWRHAAPQRGRPAVATSQALRRRGVLARGMLSPPAGGTPHERDPELAGFGGADRRRDGPVLRYGEDQREPRRTGPAAGAGGGPRPRGRAADLESDRRLSTARVTAS